MSLRIALFEPEIPPNTGNIIRLCANTNTQLHLIHPLGFSMNEKTLKRAGLDYRECARIQEYLNWQDFLEKQKPNRIFACTTKTKQWHSQVTFRKNDVLLFGPESRGLPKNVRDQIHPSRHIRIPMQANSRSMNLSNAVSVILYEALRQLHYPELC